MNIARFHDGGFVVHGIRGAHAGRVSAWYDRAGNILDAEQLDARGFSRNVKPGGPIWQTLERIGRRYVEPRAA